MGWSAFAPKGLTVAISAATTAPTGVQVPCTSGETQNDNYLIGNGTTQGATLGYGPTAAAAQALAASGGVWIPGGSIQSFSFGPLTFFSAATTTGTTTVYVTPGDGL